MVLACRYLSADYHSSVPVIRPPGDLVKDVPVTVRQLPTNVGRFAIARRLRVTFANVRAVHHVRSSVKGGA